MVEFYEGFDAYSNTNFQNDMILYGWNAAGAANHAAGRNSYSGLPSQALNITTGNGLGGYNQCYVSLPAGEIASRTVGFACYMAATSRQGAICSLYDGGTCQFSISWAGSTGTFYVQTGSDDSTGPFTGGTCSGTFGAGAWYYIEFSFTLATGASAITVKVNGTTVLNLTGLSTMTPSGNAQANNLAFGGLYGAGATLLIDDIYVMSAANAFLGNTQCVYIPPTADSSHGNTAWTPDSGTVGYSRVNTLDPYGSTEYVQGTAIGQVETFSYTIPSAMTGNVNGVKVKCTTKQIDAGSPHAISAVVEKSGTNYVDSNTKSTTTTNVGAQNLTMTVNPATSSAFTTSDLASCEFGIKLVS